MPAKWTAPRHGHTAPFGPIRPRLARRLAQRERSTSRQETPRHPENNRLPNLRFHRGRSLASRRRVHSARRHPSSHTRSLGTCPSFHTVVSSLARLRRRGTRGYNCKAADTGVARARPPRHDFRRPLLLRRGARRHHRLPPRLDLPGHRERRARRGEAGRQVADRWHSDQRVARGGDDEAGAKAGDPAPADQPPAARGHVRRARRPTSTQRQRCARIVP